MKENSGNEFCLFGCENEEIEKREESEDDDFSLFSKKNIINQNLSTNKKDNEFMLKEDIMDIEKEKLPESQEDNKNIKKDEIINMEEVIIREILTTYETSLSEYISQEEKLALLGKIIELEQEYLPTKIWKYRAIEQRLLVFIENLDKEQVEYTFNQLIKLKNEVDEDISKATMENIISILKNKDVIAYSRPIVSIVVNILHQTPGTEKYYTQLLKFLQDNKYFFVKDEKMLKFPIDLIMEYVKDINIFSLEVHVVGNEEKAMTIADLSYTPPYGWTCYEFNIHLKYDNGDDRWMKMDGNPGEWAVAYHGVARNRNNEQIFSAIDSIVKTNLNPGQGQSYESYKNINIHTNKQYPYCGKGVYLTPNIQVAETYAGMLNINGKYYYTVLQFRVNPKHLRITGEQKDYWICLVSTEGVRPYRLLLKERGGENYYNIHNNYKNYYLNNPHNNLPFNFRNNNYKY